MSKTLVTYRQLRNRSEVVSRLTAAATKWFKSPELVERVVEVAIQYLEMSLNLGRSQSMRKLRRSIGRMSQSTLLNDRKSSALSLDAKILIGGFDPAFFNAVPSIEGDDPIPFERSRRRALGQFEDPAYRASVSTRYLRGLSQSIKSKAPRRNDPLEWFVECLAQINELENKGQKLKRTKDNLRRFPFIFKIVESANPFLDKGTRVHLADIDLAIRYVVQKPTHKRQLASKQL